MPTADGGSRPAFEWYVEQGRCDEVDYLADQITSISKARGLTDYAEICLVLDLVQTIEYRLDDDPRHPGQTRRADYWRFPLETIADRAGDCEDSAILTVALLSSLGHRTCFFDLPGHAAIGVAGLPETTGTYVTASDGSWFYYTETTADGYAIGELPEEVQREDLRISAIVEPLRGRQRDPLLVPTRPGHWRRQSWAIAFSFAGMTAAAAALGFAVSYWA
jgi:hypothetical protein